MLRHPIDHRHMTSADVIVSGVGASRRTPAVSGQYLALQHGTLPCRTVREWRVSVWIQQACHVLLSHRLQQRLGLSSQTQAPTIVWKWPVKPSRYSCSSTTRTCSSKVTRICCTTDCSALNKCAYDVCLADAVERWIFDSPTTFCP